jgi:hypothetical protein
MADTNTNVNADNTTTTDSSNLTTGTGTNLSLWENLKNKVKYTAFNAVSDPKANEFVKTQQQKSDSIKKSTAETSNTTDSTNSQSSTNSSGFSTTRLLGKVKDQTVNIIKYSILPFVSLMLAMLVANDLIVYSPPIRILFFIFTIVICMLVWQYSALLSIIYIFKGGYSYYINHMTDKPRKDIVPTIFALLPITTYKPVSRLGSILLYPFTYPKTEKSSEELTQIMSRYVDNLEKSFKAYDTIKNIPIFSKSIQQAKNSIELLHKSNQAVITTNETTGENEEAGKNEEAEEAEEVDNGLSESNNINQNNE